MNKLYKNEDDGLWFGVLLGFSEYFDIDVAFLRIGFCIFTIVTGLAPALLLYFICAICIPENPHCEQRRQGLRMLRDIGRK